MDVKANAPIVNFVAFALILVVRGVPDADADKFGRRGLGHLFFYARPGHW
jgi:hypothetical protein